MPSPTASAPWRIYLLVDPTTGPTNHALGTIFYVGLRSDLPEPVNLLDATEPQSIPEMEAPARQRLAALAREGVRVIVEVIPEQGWNNVDAGVARAVGALCATLHPAPLNVRDASVRWPAQVAQSVEDPPLIPLPEGGAIIRRHQGEVPVAMLPLLGPEALFREHVETVQGLTSPRAISNQLREGGPLPLFLVAEGRTGRGVLPSNFVVGAWMVEAVEPINQARTEWRVTQADDPEVVQALRRRYLNALIDPGEPASLSLRKA